MWRAHPPIRGLQERSGLLAWQHDPTGSGLVHLRSQGTNAAVPADSAALLASQQRSSDDAPYLPTEVVILSLHRATLIRPLLPARNPLVVVAVYGTMYATWRPHTIWGRLGQYAPTYARIPIDDQFGLELLGGTRMPCPNTDKVAGPRLYRTSDTFRAWVVKDQNGQRFTKLHCQVCNYRIVMPGRPETLRAEDWSLIRHPSGPTVIYADVPQASVPNASTGFDFARGCLIRGDDDAIDVVYGSRLRVTDRFLDKHLGPAKRTHYGRGAGGIYVVRSS